MEDIIGIYFNEAFSNGHCIEISRSMNGLIYLTSIAVKFNHCVWIVSVSDKVAGLQCHAKFRSLAWKLKSSIIRNLWDSLLKRIDS